MPEEQAFCVLVKLMFDYELREMYRQGFENLHLRFHQLERLIQVSEKQCRGMTPVRVFTRSSVCVSGQHE